MKKLFKALYVILVIIVIVVLLLAAAAFGFYQMYLKPQPAEFEFTKDVSSMTTVEVVEVKRLGKEKFDFIPVTTITDTEAFLADFGALECNKGMSIGAIQALSELESIRAIKITYADESYEVITPYGNINSDIFSTDISLDTLLNKQFFMFDVTEFDGLINKYTAK